MEKVMIIHLTVWINKKYCNKILMTQKWKIYDTKNNKNLYLKNDTKIKNSMTQK